MKEIGSLSVPQAVALLNSTPKTLHRHLQPLDASILSWRFKFNQRTIKETVGHLIESDQHAFVAPIQLMLNHDLPELETWNARLSETDRNDNSRDIDALLAELKTVRQKNVATLAQLRPGQLARSGFHPRVGELHVVNIIYNWVYHDCKHLKQIMDMIQMAVWPKMGNIRHFSPPE